MASVATRSARSALPSRDSGGTPIVFLHGVGSDKSVWRPQLDHFGRSRRAMALRLSRLWRQRPGAGGHDARRLCGGGPGGDGRARDRGGACVRPVARRRDRNRHSRGRAGALRFADHCRQLRGPPRRARDLRAVDRRQRRHARACRRPRRRAARAAGGPGGCGPRCRDDGADRPGGVPHRRRSRVARRPARARRRDRRARRWSIVGEEDKVTPPDLSRELADAIPGAQLHVIPGAGHLANIEKPDAFNRLVEQFIGGVEAHP